MPRGGGGGKGGRGGGSRGGKEKGPLPREVAVSKKLSWLLRHGAEKEGLMLKEGGFAVVQEVLQNRNIRSLQPPPTLEEIRDLVDTNDKQRFTLMHVSSVSPASADEGEVTISSVPSKGSDADDDPKNWLIRANQGHSLQLSESSQSSLLKPLTMTNSETLPKIVVHGTTFHKWPLILKSGGLKPMGRNHVHFATGLPSAKFGQAFGIDGTTDSTAKSVDELSPDTLTDGDGSKAEGKGKEVISGMRSTSTLLIFINLKKALEEGIPFSISSNGVVLSEGSRNNGIVPLSVFEKVVEKGGKVVLRDGKIVNIDGTKE